MPRLPTPEEYGHTSVRPSRGVARVEADPLGRVMMDFASDLGRMAEEETRKLEDLSVQNALNELETADMEMTYGDNGYLKVKGQKVLDTPLLKTMPEAYSQKIAAISAKLNSARARQMFEMRANRQKTHFISRLMQHVATQSEVAFGETWEATKQRLVNRAAVEPEMLDAHLAKADELIGSLINHKGLKMDSEEGKLIAESIRSDIVMPAIKKALATDDAVLARSIFDRYKTYLGTKADDFEVAVKKLEAEAAAIPLAQKAMAAYRGGASNLEVEKMIQEDAGANKTLRDTAQSEYRRLRIAYDLDMQDKQGSIHLEFLASPNAATANKLQRSEAFLALPRVLQEQTVRYMQQQLEHQEAIARSIRAEARAIRSEARAEAAAARAEAAARQSKKEESLEAYRRYLDILDNPDFIHMTENQLGAYLPELGEAKTKALIAERRRRLKEGQAFSIPKPIIDSAVAEIKNKEDQKAARGLIQYNLALWKDQNPGRTPTEEEQYRIVRSALMEFTVPGRLWDTTGKAYELKPIPRDFRNAAIQKAREKGKLLTEQDLLNLWAQQEGSRR